MDATYLAVPMPCGVMDKVEVSTHVQLPAVVRRVDHDRVGRLSRLVESIQHAADAVIHVLDERQILHALRRGVRLALLYAVDPLLRRLDGRVRGIVGEVQEERLRRVLP